MRISDWSSDVCSSDLPAFAGMTQSFNNMLNLIGSPPTNKSEREENAYVRSVIHGLVLAGGGVSAGLGPVRPAADGGGWRRRSEKDRIRQHRQIGRANV